MCIHTRELTLSALVYVCVCVSALARLCVCLDGKIEIF